MRKLFLLVLVLFCVLCSCARRGIPPGGPVDVEPPRIISSAPDSGEVRVAAVSEICVVFSEPMDKRTVRDAIVVRPVVKVSEARWQRSTFCLVLRDSLLSSTTYSVTVLSGCRDAHGNGMKAPHVWAFSTGDTLLAGVIRGKVLAKGLPAPGTLVWVFDSLRCPAPDFTRDEPDYVSQSWGNGAFEVVGLRAGFYLLFAFKDKNLNRVYDEGVDFVSPAQSAVLITPEEPVVTDVEIRLVDPNEPGKIEGVVEHCQPDTVRIVVRAVSVKDSLSSFDVVAKADSSFSIGRLPAGQYRVDCFADINSNRVYDSPLEPRCEEPHLVQVMPGEATKQVKLTIPCASTPLREEQK